MTSVTSAPGSSPGIGGLQTVRRLIMYALLALSVIIAASGLSGLLNRLLTATSIEVVSDSFGLATSLAAALIAGPLAALLWWLTWRDWASARDRASVSWPVYLVTLSTVALLTATISLLSWAADAITAGGGRSGLGVGIIWSLIWLWHYWMWRHPGKGPTRLRGAAPAIASFIGLSLAAGGLVFTLARLVDSAVESLVSTVLTSDSVAQLVLQPLVWAVGGALVWGWHWFRAGVRTHSTGLSNVLLIVIAGAASPAAVALGLTLILTTILELASQQPPATALAPLGIALATAAVGALVVVYHAPVVAAQTRGVRCATRLARAGVSLAFAATGVGVTVNALLATRAITIIEGSITSLLLGGLSALAVGGVLWWLAWRPVDASTAEYGMAPGRRIYLVIIFGLSALVALSTLLVIAFQLFSFLLDGGDGESYLERSRQALGLLTATALVAAYHFAVWRTDRLTDDSPERMPRISLVTLVVSGDSGPLAAAVRVATGARVRVLARAGESEGEADASAIVAALTATLADAGRDPLAASPLLVITGSHGSVEVIRLRG